MTKDTDALREAVVGNTAIEKIAILSNKDWPLARVNPDATLDMIHEIAVEAIYPTAPTALATPASDVAPVEYETLIAAGFDEYAAHCALRTEPDGGFCHAYFYSDGQWRFQTGGNDLTLADGTILRCVLTKRLFAHPPAHPVDPAGGEALREGLTDADWDRAQAETDRLTRELDIANADHIALWLEANMADSPLAWLACRIVEAHDAALAALKGPAA